MNCDGRGSNLSQVLTASVHLSSVDMQHAGVFRNHPEPVLSHQRTGGPKKNMLVSVWMYKTEGGVRMINRLRTVMKTRFWMKT